MGSANKKYAPRALAASLLVVVGVMLGCSPAHHRSSAREEAAGDLPSRAELARRLAQRRASQGEEAGVSTPIFANPTTAPTLPAATPAADTTLKAPRASAPPMPLPSTLDTLGGPKLPPSVFDTIPAVDTVPKRARRNKAFLEHPVFGKNRDSLIYDVRHRLLFVYGRGDLTYEENNLKADHMVINTTSKEIFGVGLPDSAEVVSRPEFTQGSTQPYTMDTITFNLTTKQAKIKGVATKDGEGYLLGRELKRMADGSINIAGAAYTTCDHIDHPHFYIAMTKAKMIPGKKIIMGPAYFVMEDVPFYLLGLPGGFFPISTGPKSGFIMPKYGEEAARGFYLRDGGYYFRFGDKVDLRLTGGFYTLGSWEANAASNYIVRYRFAGSLSASYAHTVLGEKGTSSRGNPNSQNQFRLQWSHRMDPKAHPGTTFSASVNFATSGFNRQATPTLNEYLNTQTNSSISYSKQWMAGTTPINLTVAMTHSSEAKQSTISFNLPTVSFTVGTFNPFKRKVQIGKPRWYERIKIGYTMRAENSIPQVKENELFTKETFEKMRNGVSHSIPVSTSFNFFDVVSFTPSFNYNESWSFKRQRNKWDPSEGKDGAMVPLKPEFGFFRLYDWSTSGSFSTKLYGMIQMADRKDGKPRKFRALRHVVTPTVGFSYSPDFRHPSYGFYDHVQSKSDGTINHYSPLVGTYARQPGGPSASINFSLSNQLEIKVSSKRDSTGVKKIPIIENFSLSGGYNFLAREFKLQNIAIQFRTGPIFKNFAIQLSAMWDPYTYEKNASGTGVRRVDRFNIGRGKFGRITSTGWSFGYTFNSPKGSNAPSNNLPAPIWYNPWDPNLDADPATRRLYMVQSYYDFNIPWNFSFNYSVTYSHTGLRPSITQTLGFNGNVTLTPKWGVTFTGGFDIVRRRFTPMQISLSRDLHCWSMSFQWVPMGAMKSYSFHIGIKSSMLADIKYDKHSSRYDNLND